MNAELKAKWVAALRSGKFTQHLHQLNNDEDTAHCCLGVLCKVNGIDNPQLNSSYQDIREILGVAPMGQFIRANDVEGKTFEQIADLVEATYAEAGSSFASHVTEVA